MAVAMTAPRAGASSSSGKQHRRRTAAAAAAALVLALAFTLPSASSASSGLPARVIELNDQSFEHDTQASTGQTTGHWAVLLHDSSAVKTRAAAQSAQKALAALAASRAAADEEDSHDPGCLYASVDASEEVNPALAARFRGFLPGPVLLLFRDRQLFPLPLPRVMLSQQQLERAGSGASRSEEQAVSAAYHAILDFLSGGFREVDSELIPPPAGGAGGALGGGAVAKAIDFLARQTADLDGDHLMVIGIATVVIGVVMFVGFFGLAVVVASRGKVGSQAVPAPAPAAAAAAAAAKKKKKDDDGAKPAPVPEENKKEEAEEDDLAEEVAAKGEEEEEEEEEKEEAAAGGSSAVRRRRRQA